MIGGAAFDLDERYLTAVLVFADGYLVDRLHVPPSFVIHPRRGDNEDLSNGRIPVLADESVLEFSFSFQHLRDLKASAIFFDTDGQVIPVGFDQACHCVPLGNALAEHAGYPYLIVVLRSEHLVPQLPRP